MSLVFRWVYLSLARMYLVFKVNSVTVLRTTKVQYLKRYEIVNTGGMIPRNEKKTLIFFFKKSLITEKLQMHRKQQRTIQTILAFEIKCCSLWPCICCLGHLPPHTIIHPNVNSTDVYSWMALPWVQTFFVLQDKYKWLCNKWVFKL